MNLQIGIFAQGGCKSKFLKSVLTLAQGVHMEIIEVAPTTDPQGMQFEFFCQSGHHLPHLDFLDPPNGQVHLNPVFEGPLGPKYSALNIHVGLSLSCMVFVAVSHCRIYASTQKSPMSHNIIIK